MKTSTFKIDEIMIKNFLYLDSDKVDSFATQVFDGLPEYILNKKVLVTAANCETIESSNRTKAYGDILLDSSSPTEREFLHDQAYNLLESKLIDDDKVLQTASLDSENFSPELINTQKTPFIKVRGKVKFNDINSLTHTLENFNEFGKAITYISTHDEILKIQTDLNLLKSQTSDRNEISKLERKARELEKIDKIAQERNLYQDKKFSDALNFLLQYGFQDQFEVQIQHSKSLVVCADLKRNKLKEDEDLILRKYSRFSEVDFTLFGVITQFGRSQLELENQVDLSLDFESTKDVLINMVDHLTIIENRFTGRSPHEVIIDPVALYTEF